MRYHILVVEDDAVTREKLTGYFEREGYRVTAVENGQEMRAVLAEQTVDLVMLDINLPGEDGLLLTRELRARSTVGIILMPAAVMRWTGLSASRWEPTTMSPSRSSCGSCWCGSRICCGGSRWRPPRRASLRSLTMRCALAWRFDIPRRQLSKDGVPVRLTKAEYEVLVAFVAHAGRVLSRGGS